MKAAKVNKINYLILIISLLVGITTSAQTVLFSDDFETGTSNWVLTGSWGLSTVNYYSGLNSLTDSPGLNYTNMQSTTATMAGNLNLSSYLSAELSFWAKYDIEASFDFVYLEISKDGGNNYVLLDDFTDVSSTWTQYTYNIGSFAGYANVKIRYRFYSDQYVVGDGIYIDDIQITGSAIDNSPPLIVHDGPVFYEGEQGSFTVDASISDPSGISETTLYYYLDGSGPNLISGVNISGDEFRFVIPAQSAGTNVSYKIKASDNSSPQNSTDTSSAILYQYISGTYLGYDDGIVDAVSTISGNIAVAVKITIPAGQYGFLRSSLIRNYRDVNNVNDQMLFHVWDNNNGVPGNDIITPFLVTPEATLDNPFPFTRIDLRSYSPELDDLTGDIFIGFSVPQNSVSIIVSNNSNGRSFRFDGTNWITNSKDYEFRAIIFESSTPLPVELSTFEAKVNGQSVALNWETVTEVNNFGFEIERRDEQNDWGKIGFVDGHGNSNSPKHYLFEDESIKISGKYYYRLKQIDIDGRYEYSEMVEASVEAPNEFSLNQNYPNPFNPTTSINYVVPNILNGITNVRLKVFDVLGNELITLVDKNQPSGKYEVEFNASNYPSGMYFYSLTVGDLTKTKKMMLMK